MSTPNEHSVVNAMGGTKVEGLSIHFISQLPLGLCQGQQQITTKNILTYMYMHIHIYVNIHIHIYVCVIVLYIMYMLMHVTDTYIHLKDKRWHRISGMLTKKPGLLT